MNRIIATFEHSIPDVWLLDFNDSSDVFVPVFDRNETVIKDIDWDNFIVLKSWENSPKKLVLEDKTKLRLPVGGSDFDIDASNKRLEFIEKRLVELNASIEKIMDVISIGKRLS